MDRQQFLNLHYFAFLESLNWEATPTGKHTLECLCNAMMLEAAYVAEYNYKLMSQVKPVS